MASIKKNTTDKTFSVKKSIKISIVKSEYNPEITNALLDSCVKELKKAGVQEKNIQISEVPGAFELPLGCQRAIQKDKPHAVIALGLVLKGATPHFDFVAGQAARGIMEVSLKFNLPVIFGVLTTNNMAQARERIHGGKRGDKGVEAAQTALGMVSNFKF